MVTIKKKLYFLTVTETWFDYRPKLSDLFLPVIYKDIKKLQQRFYFGIKNFDHTAELDIGQPAENIFSSFRTTVKTEIRKAEKEGVECYFHDDKEGFIRFFNDFAFSKNLEPVNKTRLEEMSHVLKISYAVMNGEILAAHTYLEDKASGIARSMHSASKRFDENFNHNQIARANKLLHYKDMLYFKERGIKNYDFGSYQIGDGSKGLLEFKQSLGGEHVTSVFYMTYTYYLLQQLQKLIQFLKNKPHRILLNSFFPGKKKRINANA